MEAYCNPIIEYSTLSEVIRKQKEVKKNFLNYFSKILFLIFLDFKKYNI